MNIEDIEEGCAYTNNPDAFYFRKVCHIITDAGHPPVVYWSTDGFDVSDGGRTRGRCQLSTFAKRAKAKFKE